MNELFFSMFTFGSYNDPEYYNLDESERKSIDYVNSCINNNDKRISDASFYMMLMLIEISNEPDKYEPEDIQLKKEKIVEGLNEKEVAMMDKFLLECINTMGIYSEEAKLERKLKNERND